MDDLQEQLSRAGVEDEDGSVYAEKYDQQLPEGYSPSNNVLMGLVVRLPSNVLWLDDIIVSQGKDNEAIQTYIVTR